MLCLPVTAFADPFSTLRDSIIRLEVSGVDVKEGNVLVGSVGTGFVVDGDYVITTTHLFDELRARDATNVEIHGRIDMPSTNAKKYPLKFIRYLKSIDLTLLRLVTPRGENPFVSAAIGDSSDLKKAANISYFTSGFSEDGYEEGAGSIVQMNDHQDPYSVRFNFPVKPGQSGSPVFDAEGKVLGVVKSNRSEADKNTFVIPINFALPMVVHLKLKSQEEKIFRLDEAFRNITAYLTDQKPEDIRNLSILELSNQIRSVKTDKSTRRNIDIFDYIGEKSEDQFRRIIDNTSVFEKFFDIDPEWRAEFTSDGSLIMSYGRVELGVFLFRATFRSRIGDTVEKVFGGIMRDSVPASQETSKFRFDDLRRRIRKEFPEEGKLVKLVVKSAAIVDDGNLHSAWPVDVVAIGERTGE